MGSCSTWRPWTDLTIRNLSSLFARVLRLTADPFDRSLLFCDYDREVFHENRVEKALGRFIILTVNRMLQQAYQVHHLPPYNGSGSAVGSSEAWPPVSSLTSQVTVRRLSFSSSATPRRTNRDDLLSYLILVKPFQEGNLVLD
ncbi:hypothetical protein QBC37DRAFT_89909 [Rhypophila decipiens]|uniref:Uncharacterized protein n=1 Tax=Rhypophila decipiens TaxID=261697 RepID=A0AAN7B4A8_9PEZI|nr:hypothetical protein QBC37DRAFT_89909 [Rhypophila decipiens]